jgi:hypothetical protein
MFYTYNNTKNIVGEENIEHLIKVLENEGNSNICSRSVLFMKMPVCVISIADGVA